MQSRLQSLSGPILKDLTLQWTAMDRVSVDTPEPKKWVSELKNKKGVNLQVSSQEPIVGGLVGVFYSPQAARWEGGRAAIAFSWKQISSFPQSPQHIPEAKGDKLRVAFLTHVTSSNF
jgi:hypothetical protein